MKLVFLGDSFTWGWGIEIEYGLKNGLIRGDECYFKKIFPKETSKEINKFRMNHCWPALLAQELHCDFENLSLPAANMQIMMSKIFDEGLHGDLYVLALPLSKTARILISSKEHKNYYNRSEVSLTHLFNTHIIRNDSADYSFFSRYYDQNSISFLELQSLLCFIHFLKSKNKKFLILPCWEKTIEDHFSLDHDKKIFQLYKDYIFSQLESELNFSFSCKINKLPCGHPDIKSQINIKNAYIDIIREKIK